MYSAQLVPISPFALKSNFFYDPAGRPDATKEFR